MKFRENIDLGLAFENLKKELAFTDASLGDRKEDLKYRWAYARLSGAIQGTLAAVEADADDLKNVSVFEQSARGKEIDRDIENELIN